MTPEILAEIAAEANLAPSAHNTQPVLWHRDGADGIILSLDPARLLHIGDPDSKDARLSGGAALLGTQYALWRRGLGVRGVEPDTDTLRLAIGGEPAAPAPELDLLRRRTCYRAGFAPATGAQIRALTEALQNRDDAYAFTDPSQIAAIAELNDAASLGFMAKRPFREELLSWMRLSRNDPNWNRDGLSAEALALSGIEAFGARIALRAPIFEGLNALGLARGLTAEAAKTNSATALIVVHRGIEEDRWTSGNAFYDLWLALTGAGFAAWPMAVLADNPETCAEVKHMAKLGDDRTLITVLRVGPHPGANQAPKARLPGLELIRAA
ncbi:hypothetical protein V8J82_00190 [Gymnodinialimonas sp. 2305UL16-5]|uniref:hypothetical protein n=1 Tax=Gymnodinialimonas mytili TaxID=3126503 RepID=UPI0030B17DE3